MVNSGSLFSKKNNIDAIIRDADNDDWKKRAEIKDLLIKQGESVIPELVSFLKTGSWYQRSCVSNTLKALGWKPTDDVEKAYFLIGLMDIVKGTDDKIVEIGTAVVECLIPLLMDRSSWAVGKTADILGRIGDSRATEPLIDALGVSDTNISVIRALGKIGDQKAVRPLMELLKKNSLFPGVKGEIVEALNRLGIDNAETQQAKGKVRKYHQSFSRELYKPRYHTYDEIPMLDGVEDSLLHEIVDWLSIIDKLMPKYNLENVTSRPEWQTAKKALTDIGWQIFKKGGMPLMQKIHDHLHLHCYREARYLERAWDGVGRWQA